MAFTDVDLGWRWVNWIQFIIMGGFCPIVFVIMRETRSTVLLRRKAAKLRKERGLSDGGARYIARSEIEKIKFSTAMIQSMSRPMIFLFTEPIVTFFALWIALGVSNQLTTVADVAVGRVLHPDCRPAVHVLKASWVQYHPGRAGLLDHVCRRHHWLWRKLYPGESVPRPSAQARRRGASVRADGRGRVLCRWLLHHWVHEHP